MLKSCVLPIWFLIVLLFPVYLFDSGGIQIAHGLIIVGLFIQLLRKKLIINAPIRWLFVYSTWCICINTFWGVYYEDIFIFRNALFVLFNFFAVVYTISILHEKPRVALKLFFYAGFAIATILIVLYFTPYKIYFSEYNQTYRYTGCFHNPNQLVFWGVVMLVTLLIISSKLSLSKSLYTISEILLIILVILSASRSGFVCLLFYSLFRIRRLSFSGKVFIFFCFFLLGCYVIDFEQIKGAERVLESINDRSYSVSEDRGFDRIINYPEYLFLGAGESGLYRWNTMIELHSTFLTILFSYGIVGCFLFLGFVYKLGFRFDKKSMTYILPIFFCLFAHNELRFSILWISLAVFYFIYSKHNRLLI